MHFGHLQRVPFATYTICAPDFPAQCHQVIRRFAHSVCFGASCMSCMRAVQITQQPGFSSNQICPVTKPCALFPENATRQKSPTHIVKIARSRAGSDFHIYKCLAPCFQTKCTDDCTIRLRWSGCMDPPNRTSACRTGPEAPDHQK